MIHETVSPDERRYMIYAMQFIVFDHYIGRYGATKALKMLTAMFEGHAGRSTDRTGGPVLSLVKMESDQPEADKSNG